MKIKYIYQLFISHISVIIIAFLVLSLTFSQYVERLVYENKAEELITYGKNILTEATYSMRNNSSVLDNYQRVLAGRNIQYRLFNENKLLQYPITGRISMSDEEWDSLRDGEIITISQDYKRFGTDGVTIVLIPYFYEGSFKGGIMLGSPISGTREMISEINHYLLYTVFIALTVTVILSFFFSKFHVNRIKRIQRATSSVAEGDYKVHLQSSNFDEIGELAEDFNKMVDKINQSMEEIQSLENRRRQFMADVSHELRTPLTTIRGVIEGLRTGLISEEDREKGINLVNMETKRLLRLVNENLDYEKIRSNQVVLNKVNINASEIFEIIREQLEILAEEKHNTIRVDAPEGLTIFADYDRLTQIIINLMKNSIQFTENGIISIRGKTGYKESIIEIEDTGTGIDPDEVEKIWQRFYKAEISRTNNSYGEFGLGLSIVKQLVTMHNGRIEVESQKETGTKFTIYLPDK
ncbi:MAG: ATP-binding protein [Bacillus sp. (in: firmicutes)]